MKKSFKFSFLALSICSLLAGCVKSETPSKENKRIITNFANEVEEIVSKKSDPFEIRVIRNGRVGALEEDYLEFGSLNENDIIEIDAPYQYIIVNLFEEIGDVMLFSPTGQFSFQVPSGTKKNMYGNIFAKAQNTFEVRKATIEEIKNTKNLALNPFDMMFKDEVLPYNNSSFTGQVNIENDSPSIELKEVRTFPHAYSNRVTRNEVGFYARNAIDGNKVSNGHGNYPYESWGYDQKDDAEYLIYFGREVELTSLGFVLRADYSGTKEHDTYWESADVEFENGKEITLNFEKSGDLQAFQLETPQKTSFIRLKNLKSKINSSSENYAALIELEANGTDLVKENPLAKKPNYIPKFGGKKKTRIDTKEYSYLDIEENAERFNDWFIDVTDKGTLKIKTYNDQDEIVRIDSADWRDSVYYSGLYDYFLTTGNLKHYYYLRNMANKFGYKVNNGTPTPHGDHYQIGETYMGLNDLFESKYKLEGVKANADYVLARDPNDSKAPSGLGLDTSRDWSNMSYWWCDALYMAMNSYTLLSRITDKDDYINRNFEGYKFWKNKLYNTTYDLWHRDSTQIGLTANAIDEETNAKFPLFWSRGNAWVFAALAKQLEYLDEETYPEIYDTYKEDYIKIAESLAKYQREDGLWNASIVDETCYGGKEVTGTSGFIYGFSVGMELGILNKKDYLHVVLDAYNGIVDNCVIGDTDQLGYMQTVGYQPQNYRSEDYSRLITNEFGMGLFLLASSSLMRLCYDYKEAKIVIPQDAQTSLL